MFRTIGAIDPALLENSALGISAGSLVIALLLLKVVSSIAGKIVSSVVMVALAFGGWSQRGSITDCVDAVKAQAVAGASMEATCTFFGQDVTLKIPIPSA